MRACGREIEQERSRSTRSVWPEMCRKALRPFFFCPRAWGVPSVGVSALGGWGGWGTLQRGGLSQNVGATHLLGARVFSLQRNGSSEAGCRCCWLASEAGCRCCSLASLHCASLECASLECASLECASLECASLSALEGGCSQFVCDWFACDWFVCDWLAMVLASAHALSSHQLATCTPWRYRSHRCARDIRHSSCEEAAIKRGGKNSAISDVSLSLARSVCVCVSFSLSVCAAGG